METSSLFLLLLLLLPIALLPSSTARDHLTPTQPLHDGQTLVSPNATFELGFFTPARSPNRYLAIWFARIPVLTPVWVANRDRPLSDRSGILYLSTAGTLTLLNSTGSVLWSSRSNPLTARNPVARLLDSGNLVVADRSDHRHAAVAWQSFDCPTDTWLPGMKFSSRFDLGLTSWKDGDDASLGDYTVRLDERGLPQLILYGRSDPAYRTGPWNGLRLSGTPEMKSYKAMFSYAFVSSENESYYEHQVHDRSAVTRLVLDRTGTLQRFIWENRTGTWNVYWSAPKDQCDVYGSCGPYGVCNSNENPICKCLSGFEPLSNRERSAGCGRRTRLGCGDRDGFRRVTGLKLPDTATALVNRSMGLEACKDTCLQDCECVAYAPANISGAGSGCVRWVHELMDLREFATGGQDIYVRLAATELADDGDDGNGGGQSKGSTFSRDKLLIRVVTISSSLTLVVLNVWFWLGWKRRMQQRANLEQGENLSLLGLGINVTTGGHNDGDGSSDGGNVSAELTLFRFATVVAATDGFSEANKLGEGGFGSVYKGNLSNGQEVAVKRLSSSSGQGHEEFKNEVKLIARLQHTNLVRLLGFCIEGEERMLIYEYLHNKSLDSIIFDPTKGVLLDWCQRMRIINGIAQGLLYLHKFSRLRIIHRDLKASNILLDADLNPKISDFGMARIFGGNQDHEKTNRIIGTYGYMSPEYALRGLFSEKSDVFSFGVLLLEVVSGKKNSAFQRIDHSWNLLAYAWELWEEDRALDLVDPILDDAGYEEEKLKCIHVGLLCVQQRAEDRPDMSTVVPLLGGNANTDTNPCLPSLKQPAFSSRNGREEFNSLGQGNGCSNEVTITLIQGR